MVSDFVFLYSVCACVCFFYAGLLGVLLMFTMLPISFLKTEKERAQSWVGSGEVEKMCKEGGEKRLRSEYII